MSVRQPIGVCGTDHAMEFSHGHSFMENHACLDFGNTVVLKPAEDTPLSSYHLVQALTEAGIPPGRRQSGEWRRPRCRSATLDTQRRAGGQLYWFNGHGSNHCPGLRAGLQALQSRDGRQEHHFGDGRCQPRSWRWMARYGEASEPRGQRCTAASRVGVHKSVYAEFVARFVERAHSLPVATAYFRPWKWARASTSSS